MVKASGLNQLKADAMFTTGWKSAVAKKASLHETRSLTQPSPKERALKYLSKSLP